MKLLQALGLPFGAWPTVQSLEVYTSASDSRVCDLAVFLESVSRFPRLRTRIIPFHDEIPLCRQLAAIHGVEVTTTDPAWDQLGRTLFADKIHRRSAEAWRFFRKFNALTLASGPFIFMDANSAVLHDISQLLGESKKFDVIFGHRSLPGRNFTPLGKYFFGSLNTRVGHGFGAGFWAVRSGALPAQAFAELGNLPRIREMLAVAPEQSLLNAVVAVTRTRVGLLREVRGRGSYAMLAAGKDLPLEELSRTSVVKWTGDYHSGRRQFTCRHLHRPFAEKALARTSRQPQLFGHLSEVFRSVFGHEDLDAQA